MPIEATTRVTSSQAQMALLTSALHSLRVVRIASITVSTLSDAEVDRLEAAIVEMEGLLNAADERLR